MPEIEAYPLQWPTGYKRSAERRNSKFKTTLARARDYVYAEVKRLKATDAIISTNVPVKKNGELHADWGRYKMDDPGAAVYFTMLNGKKVVLCCDEYARIWENLHAIGRAIEAIRMIDRDGVSEFLERAFTGFPALPEKTSKTKWDVLGVGRNASRKEIYSAYLTLSKKHHPDSGGSHEVMQEINLAYQEFKNEWNDAG